MSAFARSGMFWQWLSLPRNSTGDVGIAARWAAEQDLIVKGVTGLIPNTPDVLVDHAMSAGAPDEVRRACIATVAAWHASQEEAVPRSDTSFDRVSETTRGLTSTSDTSGTSDTDQEAADSRLLAGVRDGAWLDAQTFPELGYAVPGLIPEGFTVLAGRPKIGKSWLVAGMLLDVARGGRALGALPVGVARDVLYLALEDGDRRMQDRCRKLLRAMPIPARFHYLTRIQPGQVLATISAFLRRYPLTALVVLDTLGKVTPPALPGESVYQRDYRIGSALKALTDDHPGLALVANHHDRKADAEDFVDAVSGSLGTAGAADTIIVVSRKRQATDGLLKVTGREVAEGTYALQVTGGWEWSLDGADLTEAAGRAEQRQESARLGDTSNDILAFVRAHPGGVEAGLVAGKFGGGAYKYLSRLERAGKLVKSRRGVYLDPQLPLPLSEPSEVSEDQVSTPEVSDTPVAEVSEPEAGDAPEADVQPTTQGDPGPPRPRRVQLSRQKGWRLPDGAVRVDKGARKPLRRYANRFDWRDLGRPEAVERYRVQQLPEVAPDAPGDLGGHDLACWCPLDGPCHADLLLQVANPPGDVP